MQAERLKEVASIQGVRTNQLLGYGLMVGLDWQAAQQGSHPTGSRQQPGDRVRLCLKKKKKKKKK